MTGLGTIVHEVLQDLKAEVKDRDLSWQIGSLPFVSCDPGLMKQVFFNLIANAVKYTRPRHPAVIEVGQIAHEGQPAIFVKDNGVGFSMKYSGKLFGVFQRLHRREDFEGTGVGLATVRARSCASTAGASGRRPNSTRAPPSTSLWQRLNPNSLRLNRRSSLKQRSAEWSTQWKSRCVIGSSRP